MTLSLEIMPLTFTGELRGETWDSLPERDEVFSKSEMNQLSTSVKGTLNMTMAPIPRPLKKNKKAPGDERKMAILSHKSAPRLPLLNNPVAATNMMELPAKT